MLLYIMVAAMTVMGSIASLFLKRASCEKDIFALLKNINLYIGAFLYVGSAVLNIILLRFLDYSVVLPLTSLSYIWTMIVSCMFLKEKIGVKKIFGVFLILWGAIMISQ